MRVLVSGARNVYAFANPRKEVGVAKLGVRSCDHVTPPTAGTTSLESASGLAMSRLLLSFVFVCIFTGKPINFIAMY